MVLLLIWAPRITLPSGIEQVWTGLALSVSFSNGAGLHRAYRSLGIYVSWMNIELMISLFSALRVPSAVHIQHCPRRVGRRIAKQEDHRVGDLVGGAVTRKDDGVGSQLALNALCLVEEGGLNGATD
jgi:hypothetical protein